MARTVRDARLGSRTARAELVAQGKPYYRALDPGLHLGYRKSAAGGKWVVRSYAGAGVYKVETIAVADDKADADGATVLNFSQAQAAARERHAAHPRTARGLPSPGGLYTVRVCIEEYLSYLAEKRKSAADARYRAEALILPALGDVRCDELTAETLRNWLADTAQTAARLRTRPGRQQRYRVVVDKDDGEAIRRRRASANRTLTVLKAALNRAWREKKIAADDAWRRVEPYEEVHAARVRYLTVEECRRLINASEGEFRDLVRAALLTGCRFGELAAFQVRDFNPDTGTLHVRTSKSGKARHVILNDEGMTFFAELTAGRPGIELLLRKADGERWGKSNQSRPMAEACERAKIEPSANFHCLRHTWASLAVMGPRDKDGKPLKDEHENIIPGAPLLVVARNLGHADTRMVEKHYGHLSASYIADEIRRAAPRFGVAGGNVEPIRGTRQ